MGGLSKTINVVCTCNFFIFIWSVLIVIVEIYFKICNMCFTLQWIHAKLKKYRLIIMGRMLYRNSLPRNLFLINFLKIRILLEHVEKVGI